MDKPVNVSIQHDIVIYIEHENSQRLANFPVQKSNVARVIYAKPWINTTFDTKTHIHIHIQAISGKCVLCTQRTLPFRQLHTMRKHTQATCHLYKKLEYEYLANMPLRRETFQWSIIRRTRLCLRTVVSHFIVFYPHSRTLTHRHIRTQIRQHRWLRANNHLRKSIHVFKSVNSNPFPCINCSSLLR